MVPINLEIYLIHDILLIYHWVRYKPKNSHFIYPKVSAGYEKQPPTTITTDAHLPKPLNRKED